VKSKYWIGILLTAIVVGIVVLVGLNIRNSNEYTNRILSVPVENWAYRATEGTGSYGRDEYYLFDKQGIRYRVTQEVFDKLSSVPRK
jgi:hypothetical protein